MSKPTSNVLSTLQWLQMTQSCDNVYFELETNSAVVQEGKKITLAPEDSNPDLVRKTKEHSPMRWDTNTDLSRYGQRNYL